MSCWTQGPPSFPGLCQQIFRNLLAEERTLFAAPSTPMELLDADCLRGLSSAFVPHLVLIFISSPLLGSDSSTSKPSGFLKAGFPRHVAPPSSRNLPWGMNGLCPQSRGTGQWFIQSSKSENTRRRFLRASFILTADISLGMGSCPSELLSSPISSSPPIWPHLSCLHLNSLSERWTSDILIPLYPQGNGEDFGRYWLGSNSIPFLCHKITLNLVDELERWVARRGQEIRHKAGPGSRWEMRGSELSPWQKRWRREQGAVGG